MSRTREKRSRAEWVAFALAAAVLTVFVGLIVAQIPSDHVGPAPVASVKEVTERDGRYYVAVDVENRGVRTAEQVQVVATLTTDEGDIEGDQTVDFLAGGETEEMEFVFDEHPADGELTVRVSGFLLP